MKKITLAIEQEYGCSYWVAVLTEEEYAALLVRWGTLRGLYCSVIPPMIIPQAVEVSLKDFPAREECVYCHMHDNYDSRLEGSDHRIPPDVEFSMEGITYSRSEVYDFRDNYYASQGHP